MKKNTFAAAALALALVPCVCLCACDDGGNAIPPANPAEAKLQAQVTGTNDSYTNIYARAEKNGNSGNSYFEDVNSEMYYISDNDFGYAQITYRCASSGDINEIGFNYFSMKDKETIEINFSSSYTIKGATDFSKPITYFGRENEIKTAFIALEAAFAARSVALEQQNLALAVEAEIADIKTEVIDGNTVYIKNKAENAYPVTFDYDVLAKMKG